MKKPLIDCIEIRRTLQMFMQDGTVTELRALNAQFRGSRFSTTLTGCFNSIDALVDEVARIQAAKGVYIVANPVNPALLARASNRIVQTEKGQSYTTDNDIVRRRWLLIDLDPQRPTGISSTDAEHEAAEQLARRIRQELQSKGWPEPVLADSGNGWNTTPRMGALHARDNETRG